MVKNQERAKYLRKVILICFSIIFLLVFGAFIFDRMVLGISHIHPVELDNIRMEVKEGSLTRSSATIVITDTGKNKTIFGEDYVIERKVFNHWQKLNNEGGWINLVGHSVDERNHLEMYINWENTYGKLSKGRYRLMKEVNNQYIAVEFVID